MASTRVRSVDIDVLIANTRRRDYLLMIGWRKHLFPIIGSGRIFALGNGLLWRVAGAGQGDIMTEREHENRMTATHSAALAYKLAMTFALIGFKEKPEPVASCSHPKSGNAVARSTAKFLW